VDVHAPDQGAVIEDHPAASIRRAALVVAIPRELRTRMPVAWRVSAVHPALNGDEAEAAGFVLGEVDECRPEEVDVLWLPELHFDDPPTARDLHARRRSSVRPESGEPAFWNARCSHDRVEVPK
jgi:hypothetical protein